VGASDEQPPWKGSPLNVTKSLTLLAGLGGLALVFSQSAPKRNHPYASVEPILKPVLFGEGVISTGDYESHPAFMPDGRTLYFVKSTAAFTFWTIVVSRFRDGQWTTPEVAPFSGQFSDADPHITSDGKHLYFISNRPVPGKAKRDLDIWVIDNTETGWSMPRNLGAPINSDGNEWHPTLAADGTLCFGSDRPGGKGATDIYCSRLVDGQYEAPRNLGASINSEFDEYEPLIASDKSYLIFMAAGRPDSHSRSNDLYMSRQQNGAWTPARNLGDEINSHREEYSPALSPDGKYFFFSSARMRASPPRPLGYEALLRWLRGPGNGLGDIYQVDLAQILSR
jgi:Tol biopolymer transport system component